MKSNQHIYAIILLLSIKSIIAFGQLPFNPPPLESNAPDWVKLIYAEPLNLNKVDSAYNAYFEKNEYKKDNYVRYYLRLSRLSSSYRQVDGTIKFPSDTEMVNSINESNKELKNLKSNVLKTNNVLPGVWESVGPYTTYWTGTNPVKLPGQANVYSIAVSQSNPTILFAGTETGGLFKTANKGVTWTNVANNYNIGSIMAIGINPTNPLVVLIADVRRILRTTDGGTTWNAVLNSGVINSICWVNSTTVLAGCDDGCYRSIDGGVTWTKIESGQTFDVGVNPVNSQYVFYLKRNANGVTEFMKSSDYGATFSAKNLNSGIATSDGARMAVTKANQNVIYVSLLDNSTGAPKVIKSVNMGDSWSVVATGNTGAFGLNNGQGFYDFDITASSTNANEVIVGTQAIYKSTDGGAEEDVESEKEKRETTGKKKKEKASRRKKAEKENKKENKKGKKAKKRNKEKKEQKKR